MINPTLSGSMVWRVYHKTHDFEQKLFDNPEKTEGKLKQSKK